MWVGQPYLLTQRLLWNRALGGQPRPQPVVVLLGPVGSGKSEALKSISRACGAEVVHALVDFPQNDPAAAGPTTVETLARVAFELSRGWKPRPRRARFTRFTLGLIAARTSLDEQSRDAAKKALSILIEKGTHNPRADRVIDELVDPARSAGVLPALPAEIIKKSLPLVIRFLGGGHVRKAKRWHADIPQAEGATPLDALVALSRANLTTITEWLTAAFLADVRESHLRIAKPDRFSRCSCPNPDQARHWHNWVLLLDNIDHPGGARFVGDLIAARDRHLWQHPGEHDPLLVVATSGRWDPHWGTGWRAPWRSPLDAGPARPVPRCHEASYEHWAGQESEAPRSPYYPVLLDPLTIDEIAHILKISTDTPECILAHRATGGLPAAVGLLKGLLRDQQFKSGARDVLAPADPDRTDADPWRKRLAELRLGWHLTDVGIEEIIAAAPFITAPWLIPPAAAILISRPHVGLILTELRTALWTTAPQQEGATPNYGELHPWLARTLMSALARNGTCYSEQFEALLNEPDTLSDPTRTAYCQLALGQIGEVANAFEASLNQGPHQEWIDRLELVTRAPDALPLDLNCGELYENLVTVGVGNTPAGRSPAGNTIAQLITARWLVANPFAMPDPKLSDVIKKAYDKLRPPLS
ncbi:MAG: hypothetical protein JO272_01570 [Pseudonocardiales bacterium]|nr:hypothetical protein [Pseudonocardiales bacterium]